MQFLFHYSKSQDSGDTEGTVSTNMHVTEPQHAHSKSHMLPALDSMLYMPEQVAMFTRAELAIWHIEHFPGGLIGM